MRAARLAALLAEHPDWIVLAGAYDADGDPILCDVVALAEDQEAGSAPFFRLELSP